MNGLCKVVINPLPISNYVIGSTGHCVGDNITLNGSQSGVLYELYNGVVNTKISKSGPGPLDFGAVTEAGKYTIKATVIATGCSATMDGSITINPLPLQYPLTPSGPLCVGDAFSLKNSETGVSYTLWCYPTTGGLPQNWSKICTAHCFPYFTGRW